MDNYLNNNDPAPDDTYLCFEPIKKIKNRIACVLLAFQAASELTPNKRSWFLVQSENDILSSLAILIVI